MLPIKQISLFCKSLHSFKFCTTEHPSNPSVTHPLAVPSTSDSASASAPSQCRCLTGALISENRLAQGLHSCSPESRNKLLRDQLLQTLGGVLPAENWLEPHMTMEHECNNLKQICWLQSSNKQICSSTCVATS